MSYVQVVGLDPGLDGGITILGPTGNYTFKMPAVDGSIDASAVATLLRNLLDLPRSIVVMEAVHAMPMQGISSAFTFGKGYGTIFGICATIPVRLELVTPQAWKKVVLPGLIPAKTKLPDGATAAQKKAAAAAHKKAGKDAAIGWCRRAYPALNLVPEGCRVPHDGLADATCIAEFARLKFACSSTSST